MFRVKDVALVISIIHLHEKWSFAMTGTVAVQQAISGV